ncbi:hypothetical protein [Luedemannella helvata]|uniref:Anti-sigma factor n=1 Tax=Luedemannella helvata TaxID=349315 RepID=A0ABP4XDP7_9ACTN
MRHLTDGTLRRLLDEPAGVADADRQHVAGCPVCLAGLATIREDAALTGAALGGEPATDVDAGWQRLSRAVAAQESRAGAARDGRRWAAPARRWRAALRSPVIAIAGVVAVLAGASAAAAGDWLQVFRTERIAPITISQADLLQLPDLSAYGDMTIVEQPNVHGVAGAAEAEQATGLTAPVVTGELPRGITGQPAYQVGNRMSALFTFSAEKAAKAAGGPVTPPPGLDGSQFRLVVGPGIAMTWSEARGLPGLIVGRAVAPTAYSSGVPFATARDYLLSLPGVPDKLATQLRGYSGDGTTLPLPVFDKRIRTASADVNGATATVLSARGESVAAVVWVDKGIVTAVIGSMGDDEVLSVARGLR